ncbi:YybH family protein [Nocardia sp. NPDC050175]|uniref:YybH family protein n=1 Tax=Nocardia sp. NPDC050175 TaxID=3364317 RepID=UPI0037B1641A
MTRTTEATDDADIRGVIDRWVEAFRNRDVDAAMAIHAADTVSFDIAPPLRYVGTDEYRRPWEATFANFTGPIEFEIRELAITIGTDVAFSRSLNRMMGTMRDGQEADLWLRWTACFQKRDGQWLIVHDHSSVPTDFANGTALLDLTP